MADVPEEWIDAALAADLEWMRKMRSVVFRSPSRDQVRSMLGAAKPLIAAAERERIRLMAIRNNAVCADDEGTNCWFADLLGESPAGSPQSTVGDAKRAMAALLGISPAAILHFAAAIDTEAGVILQFCCDDRRDAARLYADAARGVLFGRGEPLHEGGPVPGMPGEDKIGSEEGTRP